MRRRAAALLLSSQLFLAGAIHPAPPKDVWIDTDVSIGSPIREVDDAFALVFAFHSPEIRIGGISTSYGNASLSSVDRVARELTGQFGGAANLSGRNVYAGAKSPGDIGRESAATVALATAAKKHSLTYIALGPLTNLAAALQLHPELRDRLDKIIFIGGVPSHDDIRFGAGNWLRIHDANVWKDPAAVDMVLRSQIPLLLVPISASRNLTINETDLRQLKAGDAAAQYLSRRSGSWLWFWRAIVRDEGGPVFDALGVIAVVNPQAICFETRFAEVTSDRVLIASRSRLSGRARRVCYCTCVRREAKPLLMRRLMARPSR
jgi:inosine-uridine nucleoside N-ribohydrolase